MNLFGMSGGKRAKPLVLHIDDSRLVLMTAEAMLIGLGCEAIQAFGGTEGLKIAADRKPDLILVDAMMPVMDGYETVQRLRTQKETVNIPIMMLTGDDAVRSVDRAMGCGADAYLVKPLKEALLKAKIEALLKR